MNSSQRPIMEDAVESTCKNNLLDLPAEILREIADQATSQNDLASMALACSILHAVVIPVLYSKLAVVWVNPCTTRLDQLQCPSEVNPTLSTLATLAMGEDLFQSDQLESDSHQRPQKCSLPEPAAKLKQKLRRGNNYAQYTREFTVLDDPADCGLYHSWDPMKLDRVQGKMIALTVPKMVNLKKFIWNTSKGTMKYVWPALASLADRPGHECRLGCVWVRFHEFSSFDLFGRNIETLRQKLAKRHLRVEYPTLSILPPLKSLTVLDIDEPSYLEEMAVLIERSRNRLRALRISIECMTQNAIWSNPPKHSSLASSKWPKLGGVLEVLTGSFQDTILPGLRKTSDALEPSSDVSLNLEVLELERITLSAPIMMQAIDWTRMVRLTLLKCGRHEKLWRNLRRRYAPRGAPTNFPLKLKHLHIDCISPYFMSFIKDTLAPNTLKAIFLHGNVHRESGISFNTFYRLILRRHRQTLKKVLVNVFEKHHWISTPWRFNREMLTFITSRKMSQLCELHMGIDSRDWDFLVQRLPNLPNLRALHIGTINNLESIRQTENTLAHRLLDMITLMPCLPLTYIGILDECYEIARDEPIDDDDDDDDDDYDASATEDDMSNTVTDIPVAFDSDDESDPPLPVDNEVFLDSDDEGVPVLDEPVWFDDGEEEEEEDSEQGLGGKFWLRVSFNDDKAEIFKARHGEL